MGVGIIWSWSWKREAQGPVEAMLNDVRIRRCQEGNEARGNMADSGGYSGGREGHFRAHNGGTELSTLFDYVVGARILTSHFRVGYEASIGFMVGKYISSNTGREVNSEVACEQEGSQQHSWFPTRVSLGAASRLAGVAILVPCTR